MLAYPPADGVDEVASLDDFVAGFDWTKVNTVGPIVDLDKLNWLNGSYIRSLPVGDLAQRVVDHARAYQDLPEASVDLVRRAVPMLRERLVVLGDALPMLDFALTADEELPIADEARAQLNDQAGTILAAARETLAQLPRFEAGDIEQALRERLVAGLGLKPRVAFTPPRVAISGKRVSPPLFESMELLGRDSVLTRIDRLAASL